MAITNLVTSETTSITIGASGNDRLVLAIGTQSNGVQGTVEFNGVAPTGMVRDQPSTQALIYYWLDADLPASAGTYTFVETFDGISECLLYAEGVTQAAPSQTLATADLTNGGGSGAESERILNLTSGANDDLRVFAMRNSGTRGSNIVSGVTLVDADHNNSVTGYSQTANAVGFTANVAPSAAVAALFPAAPASSLTIDSTDASMQRNTDFQVVCSTPTTAPTTGNTTLTNGNDTLTPSSVTGSDPYTLTFPVGDLSKQVDGTGYDWTLTVDAETATTGNIPLVIQAGYTKVDLVNPVTTNASLLFGYIGDAPVTGDDLEYDVTSVLDSGVTFSVAADGVWTVTEAVDGDWTTSITVDRRVVQVDGTIGATATMTFDATVLSNLTIDTSPSEIRTTEAFSFTVNSVTVPTTGNTTGNFSGLTGIAPSSVTGSGPYVITWTLPVGTSKLFSGTGYVFDITVDVDTVSSSEVPYLPVTGFSYVDLVSPVASEFTTSYSGTTPVTGDQAVYSTSTTPSGITVSVRSDLSWAIASSPASNQISKFYIVKADTTTGPTDNVIWSAP